MRIKINTTWEEDLEERRQFYAKLTYSERLYYFMRAHKKFNFHKILITFVDLKICNAKIQKGPYVELFIPDKEFNFYNDYNNYNPFN